MDKLQFLKKKVNGKETMVMVVSKDDCFSLDVTEINGLMTTFTRLKQMIYLWPSGISWTLSYPDSKLACNLSAGKLSQDGSTYVGIASYWSQSFKHPKIGIYQWTEEEVTGYIKTLTDYLKSL